MILNFCHTSIYILYHAFCSLFWCTCFFRHWFQKLRIITLINDLFIDSLQLDNDDAYIFLLYGSGALVTLWLASAIIGAIDSIPLVRYPTRFYLNVLIFNCKYCPFSGILMMLII